VSGQFAGNKMNQNIRYVLLAGTVLLPAITAPQAGTAADGASAASAQPLIMLAQAPAIDPATGKPLPKGVPPKGAAPPPKGLTPGGPTPGAGGPPPGAPKMGVQPQQRVIQPAQGNGAPPQPPVGAITPTPGAPKVGVQPQPKTLQPLQGNVAPTGQPPMGAGTPAPGAPAPKISVTPKTIQPLQGAGTPPGATPPAGAPKVGVQPKAIQPLQGNVAPAAQPPGGVSPPGAPKVGVQPAPTQPIQSTVVPPGQPRIFTPGPQGHPTAVMTGNVDLLRKERHERREANGAIVIQEPGNRLIVRDGGRAFVRHDETERFKLWGEPRLERRGTEQFAYVTRPGGVQIITVTGPDGRLLRRIRRGPDGREVILLENRVGPGVAVVGAGIAAGVILTLAAPVITIPRERYIVDVSVAPAPLLYETLDAPPVVPIERPYTIDEIKFNVALRDRMRRIDIDSITFDTGSWEVGPEQQPKLQALGDAMQQILAQRPDEIFLVEGHTDAVGNDVDNLSLSDRRAESVAVILTSVYQVPPENLVTQGYGQQFLKIPTDGPSRENRRVAARRITPLLNGGVASR
jgi:outer membrane protein OmpA-like peptidoglycan-associated protein